MSSNGSSLSAQNAGSGNECDAAARFSDIGCGCSQPCGGH
ncbi:hypothetical protein BTZ20_2516 [Rhodococcus sp. MTM3W5.2]|nr:hypothetical protein BTZ20_2516 [Rhodococcus sp. MTM3W5.2]